MLRRTIGIGLLTIGATTWAAAPSPPPSKPRGPSPSRTGHLPIKGLQLYYEVYGDLTSPKPAPLLLIPGAFISTESMKPWVAAFAPKRAVIVFDQQGHGRTADTSRKMSYEQFSDDAAALLQALKVDRADVMGYSQGGGVALQLAVRRPTLVEQAGLECPPPIARTAGTRRCRGDRGLTAEAFAGTPIEEAFKEHTPDPRRSRPTSRR